MKTLITMLKSWSHYLLGGRSKKAKAVTPAIQNNIIEFDEIELYTFHNN
jgi:hypothetical protein